MKIRIVLTPQEKQALLEAGGIKHGDIEIVVEGAKSRQSIIAEDAKKSVQRKQWAFNFLSDDEQKIIDCWNNYCEGRKDFHLKRNLPVESGDLRTVKSELVRTLKVVSCKDVLASMEQYFHTCDCGDHIWDGLNHAFKSLSGFLRSLRSYRQRGDVPWWENIDEKTPLEDDNPRLTNLVADMFAQKFLGRKTFGLKNPSYSYECFMQAAKEVAKLAQNPAFSEEDIIASALKVIEKECKDMGKEAKPSMLISDVLWKVKVPQICRSFLW